MNSDRVILLLSGNRHLACSRLLYLKLGASHFPINVAVWNNVKKKNFIYKTALQLVQILLTHLSFGLLCHHTICKAYRVADVSYFITLKISLIRGRAAFQDYDMASVFFSEFIEDTKSCVLHRPYRSILALAKLHVDSLNTCTHCCNGSYLCICVIYPLYTLFLLCRDAPFTQSPSRGLWGHFA